MNLKLLPHLKRAARLVAGLAAIDQNFAGRF